MESILSNDTLKELRQQIIQCKTVPGMSAEIGVYEGHTSKLIHSILQDTHRLHYCYDTFEGILKASTNNGDKHTNGEYRCDLATVQQNMGNLGGVIYKKGLFPDTFTEHTQQFCFVYSDTATYYGTIHTWQSFCNNIAIGGKIVFYMDPNCIGIQNAISEILIENEYFHVDYYKNLVVFTRI